MYKITCALHGVLGHHKAQPNQARSNVNTVEFQPQKDGALYCSHEIAAVESTSRRVVAHTSDGYTIESKQTVFCTGYEMPDWVPMGGHRISSTWVFATRAQPRVIWPRSALIGEAADPYL